MLFVASYDKLQIYRNLSVVQVLWCSVGLCLDLNAFSQLLVNIVGLFMVFCIYIVRYHSVLLE